MEKKDITYADVSRSLNRLEGFIDDNLLGIQPYSEGHNDIKDVTRLIDAVKYNREGDEEISYIGIYDCVDFVLNNTSMPLAKRIFAIESKIKEVEQVLLSYCHDSMIKVVSDLLWETGRILWQIGELYVEPFIQESTQTDTIPETGNKDTSNGEKPKATNEPKTKEEIIKSLEGTEIFAPTKPINLYDIYYDRLTKGKIKTNNGDVCKLAILRRVCDDDNDNIKLFKYCVERADISKLVNTGKKSYARLFMNDIASYFREPEKFRKAAAKSFGVMEVGGVGGDYKKNYRLLMEKLFSDDADYRKRGS